MNHSNPIHLHRYLVVNYFALNESGADFLDCLLISLLSCHWYHGYGFHALFLYTGYSTQEGHHCDLENN